jgi:hypothetical protein
VLRTPDRARVRLTTAKRVDGWLVAAVAAGFVLRLVQYGANRSLWLDESMLALNILDRSVVELLRPLSFDQAAPSGFLVVEKWLTWMFGSSEYALRLFPLLCGLASLPLFAVLARRLLGRYAAVLATVLFAGATSPIYYASEVKQYSSDVAVCLTLLLLGGMLARADLGGRTAAAIGVTGMVAILLSFSAVFVVGAVIMVLAVGAAVRGSPPPRASVAVLSVWLAASLVVIAVSRHTAARVELLFSYDPNAYGKANPASFAAWLRELPTDLARDVGFAPVSAPFGRLYWVAVVVSVVGAVSLGLRQRLYAGFFVAAFALTVVASTMHRYPLSERTVLFLVPLAIVLLAEGVAVVVKGVRHAATRTVVGAALAVLVLALPGWRALDRLIRPPGREETKSVLAEIRTRWRTGDTFYMSNPTQFAVRYYLECACFAPARGRGEAAWRFRRTPNADSVQANALRSTPPQFIVGRAPVGGRESYFRDVAALRGRARVWLLYTHATDGGELNYLRSGLPRDLERVGRRLYTFRADDATVYLYDLRQPAR